jgi:hypothetical protein
VALFGQIGFMELNKMMMMMMMMVSPLSHQSALGRSTWAVVWNIRVADEW